MKIWRIKKSEGCSVAYCAAWLFFWLGWLWLEFISYWMDRRNSVLFDTDIRKPFLVFKKTYMFDHFLTLQGHNVADKQFYSF